MFPFLKEWTVLWQSHTCPFLFLQHKNKTMPRFYVATTRVSGEPACLDWSIPQTLALTSYFPLHLNGNLFFHSLPAQSFPCLPDFPWMNLDGEKDWPYYIMLLRQLAEGALILGVTECSVDDGQCQPYSAVVGQQGNLHWARALQFHPSIHGFLQSCHRALKCHGKCRVHRTSCARTGNRLGNGWALATISFKAFLCSQVWNKEKEAGRIKICITCQNSPKNKVNSSNLTLGGLVWFH